MKKLIVLFSILSLGFFNAGQFFAQSMSKNTNTVSMCGCPGEVWNFNIPFKPWVSFPAPNNSKRLMHTDYGFSIPATATITGIHVSFNYTTTGFANNTLKDSLCMLFYNGGMIGTDKSTETGYYGSSGTINFGGPTDMWGMALTPAEINSPLFGFNFKVFSAVGNATMTIDGGAMMTVYYNLASGISESQKSSPGLKAYYRDHQLRIENFYEETADIEIFDITGKKIQTVVIESKSGTIDVSTFEKGIYIYRITCGTKLKTGKFYVE